MAQASAYNEKYHDDWAWSLSVKGATDEEMADAFGISVRTFPYPPMTPGVPVFGMAEPLSIIRPRLWPRMVSTT